MAFNWIDVIVLILLTIFSLKGYHSGLIKQITTIVAIVLGIYIAAQQYAVVSEFLQQKFDLTLHIANLLSFGLIILIIGGVVNYLGQLLNQMLDFLLLSFIDNLGGALFGIIKGSLIAYIFILMLVKLGNNISWQPLQQQMNQSYFIPLFLKMNPLLEDRIDQFLQ
ncbi:hypothetical protein JCM16358_10410 [Halanaerocella petrolearia]